MGHLVALLAIAGLSFAANVPLGRLRARARKFSPPWFVWTHLGVPFVIVLRVHYALTPAALVIPLLVACSIAGQVVGGHGARRV